MRQQNLRKRIAIDAARMMYARDEKEYFTAKRKAAARLGVRGDRNPQHLPSNREIRAEIQSLAQLYEGDGRDARLGEMRLAALRMMRTLESFTPKLIGSVLTGHIREGSDIDLHVFSDTISAVEHALDGAGCDYAVEQKRVIKHGDERVFTHVHCYGRFPIELTVYPRAKSKYPFRSSITGKTMETATLADVEALLRREHRELDSELANDVDADAVDRFLIWEVLLNALDGIQQNSQFHPEGDALYHSLQAFELAKNELPYDEEMAVAALLHDVGKAIDPRDHVAAGLEALEGTLSAREAFLIRHHMDALALRDGTLPAKRKRALQASEWFEDLLTLRSIDERARVPGFVVGTVGDALDWLRAFGDLGDW